MPQIKAITLAPDALDRNGLSTTETLLATRLDYLINGAFAVSGSYDRNGIAIAQTTSDSSALALNGAAGTNYRDRDGAYILIYSAGADNTGITFAVVGKDKAGRTITETVTGADNGLIVLGAVRFWEFVSVTPSSAIDGNVEVGTNGYATFATPQHLSAYSASDDTGETVTFLGEDRYGVSLTETITAADAGATVDTTQNYARIDRITASGAGAGATEAGNDGLCESQWHVLNYRGNHFSVGLGLDIVSGSLTAAVQHTFNNVQGNGFREGDATVHTHDTITGKTADFDGSYTSPPVACRLAITAFTSGSATLRIVQSGSGT